MYMDSDKKNIIIYPTAKIINIEAIEFGNNIIIDDFVFICAKKRIKLGNFIHIASFVSITGGEELIMGDFSAIATGAKILTASDDFTHGGFGNPTIPEKFRNVRRDRIHIGRFSIIGANAVVLPGVVISEGAMIGANSVISKDCDAWGIYGGVNKKIGNRDRQSVLNNFEEFICDL